MIPESVHEEFRESMAQVTRATTKWAPTPEEVDIMNGSFDISVGEEVREAKSPQERKREHVRRILENHKKARR